MEIPVESEKSVKKTVKKEETVRKITKAPINSKPDGLKSRHARKTTQKKSLSDGFKAFCPRLRITEVDWESLFFAVLTEKPSSKKETSVIISDRFSGDVKVKKASFFGYADIILRNLFYTG